MGRKALCVGINRYPGTGADLRGCVNDADDWAERLVARGYSVRQLLDGAATRAAVLALLTRLVVEAVPGDRLVVTYAGHGSSLPDASSPTGRREVLCPADVGRGHVISDHELDAILRSRRPGVQVTTIVDACHAGGMDRALLASWWSGQVAESESRFLPLDDAFEVGAPGSDRDPPRARRGAWADRDVGLMMLACQAEETARDAVIGGRPHGAFSYTATRCLDAAPHASYTSWQRDIRSRLPSLRYPQRPRMVAGPWQSLVPPLS